MDRQITCCLSKRQLCMLICQTNGGQQNFFQRTVKSHCDVNKLYLLCMFEHARRTHQEHASAFMTCTLALELVVCCVKQVARLSQLLGWYNYTLYMFFLVVSAWQAVLIGTRAVSKKVTNSSRNAKWQRQCYSTQERHLPKYIITAHLSGHIFTGMREIWLVNKFWEGIKHYWMRLLGKFLLPAFDKSQGKSPYGTRIHQRGKFFCMHSQALHLSNYNLS